jgi:hypothetical protein
MISLDIRSKRVKSKKMRMKYLTLKKVRKDNQRRVLSRRALITTKVIMERKNSPISQGLIMLIRSILYQQRMKVRYSLFSNFRDGLLQNDLWKDF